MAAPLLVISFAPADERHADTLRRHLAPLVAAQVVTTWHAGDTPPGSDREVESHRRMREAAVVVPLVSVDYLADDAEVERVLAAQVDGGARVVPVVVRECLFGDSRLGRYEALPRGGASVLSSADHDAAWKGVAEGIADLVRGPTPVLASSPAQSGRPRARLSRSRWALVAAGGAAFALAALLLATGVLSGRWRARPGGRCPRGMIFVPGGVELADVDGGSVPGNGAAVPPFCIDRTEVSVEAYQRCVQDPRGETTCAPLPGTVVWPGTYSDADARVVSRWCNTGAARGEYPVNCVDWEMAASYCRWAGKALPTAPQWRLSASAGGRRKYPWGDAAPAPGLLNACGAECREAAERAGRPGWAMMYRERDQWESTAKVGSVDGDTNEYGVRDMGGNVSEWVADMGTPERQCRGGSWTSARPEDAAITHPVWLSRDVRDVSIGLRCAAEPGAAGE